MPLISLLGPPLSPSWLGMQAGTFRSGLDVLLLNVSRLSEANSAASSSAFDGEDMLLNDLASKTCKQARLDLTLSFNFLAIAFYP